MRTDDAIKALGIVKMITKKRAYFERKTLVLDTQDASVIKRVKTALEAIFNTTIVIAQPQ